MYMFIGISILSFVKEEGIFMQHFIPKKSHWFRSSNKGNGCSCVQNLTVEVDCVG